MSGARVLHLLGLLVLVCLLGLLVFAGVWRLQGGRIERVETPSMGTRAPVGSLLWIKPADADHLQQGDFVTFHPPDQPDTTFSHLVRTVHQDGTVTTGGVISGEDPWRLHPRQIMGTVQMVWPVAGWAVKMAPILLGGLLLLAVAISRLARHWRAPAALVGVSLVLAAVILVYRPLLQAERVAFKPVDDGAQATYVGTGLMPVRLAAEPHGDEVVLGNGEVGSVHVADTDERDRYVVRLSPAVPLGFWVALVAACFIPAIVDAASRLLRRHLPTA